MTSSSNNNSSNNNANQRRRAPPNSAAPSKPKTKPKANNGNNNARVPAQPPSAPSLFDMSKKLSLDQKTKSKLQRTRTRKKIKFAAAQETIRVMVRFRPQNASEMAKAQSEEPWSTLQRNDPGLRVRNNGMAKQMQMQQIDERNGAFAAEKKFIFDDVLTSNTTQYQCFQKVAEQICDEIIQGYNGTIFVYGQSGSGKTHSMYGPEHKKVQTRDEMGIIPQSFAYIFSTLNNPSSELCHGMLEYQVQCQFIEIYNGKLKDLIDPTAQPEIHEYKVNGVFQAILKHIHTVNVTCVEEVLAYIRRATKNRTTAGTRLNPTSSRSHMILRMIVTIVTANGKRTGVGNFADLAGSERVKKTGAQGIRLTEAGNILRSLLTLSQVIEALEKGKKHVPFKDSKLTFLLKNSLGGNCKTSLLITCSPSVFNRIETIRSLGFGARCRKIQNRAVVNEVRTRAQLIKDNDSLKAEIIKLRSNLVSSSDLVTEDYKEIEVENSELKEQLSILQDTNRSIASQMQESSITIAALEEAQMEMTSALLGLKHDKKLLRSQLAAKVQDFADMELKLQALAENKLKMQSQNDLLLKNQKELQHTNDTLDIENERLQATNHEQLEKLHKTQTSNKTLSEEISNLRQQMLSELENNQNKYSAEVEKSSSLDNAISSLKSDLSHFNLQIVALNEDLKRKDEKIAALTLTVHQLQDELREMEHQLQAQRDINSKETSEKSLIQVEMDKLMAELNEENDLNDKLTLENQHMMEKFSAQEREYNERLLELNLQFEEKSNALLKRNAEYLELKKNYDLGMQHKEQQFQQINERNLQLINENKLVSETVHTHKQQLTLTAQELDGVNHEMASLKDFFAQHVQHQITEDEAFARSVLEAEKEEARQRRNGNRKSGKIKPQTQLENDTGNENGHGNNAHNMHAIAEEDAAEQALYSTAFGDNGSHHDEESMDLSTDEDVAANDGHGNDDDIKNSEEPMLMAAAVNAVMNEAMHEAMHEQRGQRNHEHEHEHEHVDDNNNEQQQLVDEQWAATQALIQRLEEQDQAAEAERNRRFAEDEALAKQLLEQQKHKHKQSYRQHVVQQKKENKQAMQADSPNSSIVEESQMRNESLSEVVNQAKESFAALEMRMNNSPKVVKQKKKKKKSPKRKLIHQYSDAGIQIYDDDSDDVVPL